jgi:hypothetical protein
MHWTRILMAMGSVAMTCGIACAEDWPELPPVDGDVLIPAQEWPREPGPRTVRVYLRYPSGTLGRVDAQTGLMLDLHNWGGTLASGTANPTQLANRYNVVAICVDYLQSGPEWKATPPYDFGYFQALDTLRALYFVWHRLEEMEKPFEKGRIYCTGGSGGGNVTLMANKLAPRTFACVIDKCGMAKLADDIAFGIPGRTRLNARYSPNPESPCYLNSDTQALRFVGHPDHLAAMKTLGNSTKVIVVHGVDDASCPFDDAREMVENMREAGIDVDAHFITSDKVDGEVFTTTGHPLGNRTRIVFQVADRYLLPDSPDAAVRETESDFELGDSEVRYDTPTGTYVISYESGYPVGRFEGRKSE